MLSAWPVAATCPTMPLFHSSRMQLLDDSSNVDPSATSNSRLTKNFLLELSSPTWDHIHMMNCCKFDSELKVQCVIFAKAYWQNLNMLPINLYKCIIAKKKSAQLSYPLFSPDSYQEQ